jgi:histidine triad (HIT) family protein
MGWAFAMTCDPCEIAAGRLSTGLGWEDELAIAIVGRYPATTGHCLVFPKKHYADIFEMPDGVAASIMKGAAFAARAIRRTSSPIGVNLVQANGAGSGQTLFHSHLHVIPRYPGDGVSLGFPGQKEPLRAEELQELARQLTLGGQLAQT